MRKFGKGIVAIMFLSGSFLTGCASLAGGRGSGEYNLFRKEAVGEGSISQYQPVAHSVEKAPRSKLASRGSS